MVSDQHPVIVVGCGIAGMTTALAAAPTPVVLLGRSAHACDSASAWAQGGIAAAVGSGDSPAAHARDTCVAGSAYNDPAMTRWLTDHAVRAISWLEAQGTVFDLGTDGSYKLGREGGHNRARIVHAGGDATGAVVMAALTAAVRKASHIHWHSGGEVNALLMRGGRVAGVGVRNADCSQSMLEARAVVMATGGIGALYACTSNPLGANGSGLALALTAGAVPRDLEFMQFHPTALKVAGLQSLPLVTEALRGVGAKLVNAHGREIMKGLHPLADLAPRDLVSRQVQIAQQQGEVYLDACHLGEEWSVQFPTVLAACQRHGIDPRTQLIPVTTAAHFHMGGIACSANGDTSLRGLFAVGEVACNGVHGANRLASNSLLEGVVFGRRLGASLAQEKGLESSAGNFRMIEIGPSLDDSQQKYLQKIMSRCLGPIRNETVMRHSFDECNTLIEMGWQARLVQQILIAAIRRKQSLGAHFRDDESSRLAL